MLEKLKDIFYDKNDIIVALALVVVGAFIISHQVDTIMTYPEQLAQELQEEQERQDELANAAKPGVDEVTDPSTDTDTPITPTPTPDPEPDVETPDPEPDVQTPVTPDSDPAPSTEFKTAVERTIEIPSGAYSQKIAAILAEAGVIPSQDEFLKAVNDAGLETKLKAGTFKIPAGSTLDDVVKIVTK